MVRRSASLFFTSALLVATLVNGQDWNALMDSADVYWDLNELETARTWLGQALEASKTIYDQDPTDRKYGNTLNDYGLCLYQLGLYRVALQYYNDHSWLALLGQQLNEDLVTFR